MTPFDIFHVDGERGLRGGERQLLYLACALKAKGHRNVVVCRKGSSLAGEAARLGLEASSLPFLGEWDPLSAWKLRGLCRKAKRPVVSAHTAHAAATAALARAIGGAPFVAHRRVDFNLSGALSRKLKYQSAGRVVAVSRAIADILRSDGMTDGRVSVVPDALPANPEECAWSGMPPAQFSLPSAADRAALRQKLAAQPGLAEAGQPFWIGNLAALVPHKDHDNLLAAAVIVCLKRPQSRFLIGGDGPEGPRLRRSVQRMGLSERVFFLGRIREPSDFLKSLDAFALSSWGEGMGSVLLEAAACGAPIAATTAGGIPEIVEAGVSGLLCPPRDAEALAANLIRLIDEPALAGKLAQAARERLPRFGLARLAAQMEETYAAVC